MSKVLESVVPNVVTAVAGAVFADPIALSLNPRKTWDEDSSFGKTCFAIAFSCCPDVGVTVSINTFRNSDDVNVYLSYGSMTVFSFKTKKDVKKTKGIADLLKKIKSSIPMYNVIQSTISEMHNLGKNVPEKSQLNFLKRPFTFQKDALVAESIVVRDSSVGITLSLTPKGHFCLKVKNYPLKDMSESMLIDDALTQSVVKEGIYFTQLLAFDIKGVLHGGDGSPQGVGKSLTMSFTAILPPKAVHAVLSHMFLKK
tara:strand:+ start:6155 stop:6922 length:768 start_codon:yes stop_codon:yes gene_type:complete